jgi:hypothetical protein
LFGLKTTLNTTQRQNQPITTNSSFNLQPTNYKNNNLVLTTFLIHNLQGNSKTNDTLLNLFRQTNPNTNQAQILTFYKNLFKLNSYLAQLECDTVLKKSLQFSTRVHTPETLLANPQYKPYFNLIVNFYLHQQLPKSIHGLNQHNLLKWSLGDSDIESLNTGLLNQQPQGVFYFTNMSNQKINDQIFGTKQPLV